MGTRRDSRVDNGGTSTCNHGPDSTLSVEDGQLKRGSGRGVELSDVGLLLGEVSSEGSGPDHGRSSIGLDSSSINGNGRGVSSDGPLGSAKEVGSLSSEERRKSA
jgi:hypothetical protein